MKFGWHFLYLVRRGIRRFLDLPVFFLIFLALQRFFPYGGTTSELATANGILGFIAAILPNMMTLMLYMNLFGVIADCYYAHFVGLFAGVGRRSMFLANFCYTILFTLCWAMAEVILYRTTKYPEMYVWNAARALQGMEGTVSLATRFIVVFVQYMIIAALITLIVSVAFRCVERTRRSGVVIIGSILLFFVPSISRSFVRKELLLQPQVDFSMFTQFMPLTEDLPRRLLMYGAFVAISYMLSYLLYRKSKL